MRLIHICFFSLFFCLTALTQERSKSIREIDYALIEASRLKALGNIEEAVKLYKTCVASYPECAAAWYELGSIYTSAGVLNEAEEFLKNAYNLNKKNYWYVIAYADILNKNNKYKDAVKVLNKALNEFPKDEISIKFNIAENYISWQKYKLALKMLTNIEDKYGKSELISAKKIDLFKKTKNDKKIEREFKKVITADPENLPFNILYAEFLAEKELYQKAIEKYEYVLSLDQENIYAISNLTELYEKTDDYEKSYDFLLKTFQSSHISFNKKIQTLSYLLSEEKRLNNHSKHIRKIIDYLYEDYHSNYEFMVVAYDFYYKIDNKEEAYKIIRKITELRSENYIFWAQALYNGIQVEDYEGVIELGEKAIKIFPNKDDIRVFMAIGYFYNKMYLDAYNLLLKTENNFTEPELKKQKEMLIAEAGYKSGFIDEAFNKFEELINQDPDNLIIKNNYSYYLALEEKNLERAKMLSYETISKEPENATFLDTYAWILFKMNLIEKAEFYIKKAVEIDKFENKEIVEHMIKILKRLGKNDEVELIRIKMEK